MRYICVVILLFFISCSSNETTKKIKKEKQKKELVLSEFFQKDLIVPSTKIVGYLNPQNFLKNNILGDKILNYNRALKNIHRFSPFYFTLSEYDKKLEILFFFFHKLNFMIDKNDILKTKYIEDYKLFNMYKTYNQKFSYLELKNSSIYGDLNLIKDLFDIKNGKIKKITEKLHKKILKRFKNNNNSILRLLFLKNNNELLKLFFPKVKLRGDILADINFILLDIYNDLENIIVSFDIEFKNNSQIMYDLLNNNFNFLMTSSYFKYNDNNIFNNFKIAKNNKNITIKLYLNKLLLKKILNEEFK